MELPAVLVGVITWRAVRWQRRRRLNTRLAGDLRALLRQREARR